MALFGSILNSLSTSQSSLLSLGVFKSQFLLSQLLVGTRLIGALTTSLTTGWQWILFIWWSFIACVHSPARFSADKVGGKGDLSHNLHSATQSCWKFDQNALTISSVSEIYARAVISLFQGWDFVIVAHTHWMPSHITKMPWSLDMLSSSLSSAPVISSKWFWGSIESNTTSSPANIPLLAPANCLDVTVSQRV
jgi:hypothetical protein